MSTSNRPGPTAPSSLSPVMEAKLGALEDKIEFYSLGLPAIALGHLILWSVHALFYPSSAIDELMEKTAVPPYAWCAFATAILFLLLFVWSFRHRVLAMQIGLLAHIATIVVIVLLSRATKTDTPVAFPKVLVQVATLLHLGAPVVLFLGIRASSEHAQLLRSTQATRQP